MQQTTFMYLQSEIKVTKGKVLYILYKIKREELCILVSHYKRIILFIVMVTIYCHGHKRKMMHVINSSSKLHTLHTEKTIQENAINCKRQEVNDKILSKKVQMYIIYNFSMNFHKVILEKDAINS